MLAEETGEGPNLISDLTLLNLFTNRGLIRVKYWNSLDMVFYIIAAAEKDKNPDKEQAATGGKRRRHTQSAFNL